MAAVPPVRSPARTAARGTAASLQAILEKHVKTKKAMVYSEEKGDGQRADLIALQDDMLVDLREDSENLSYTLTMRRTALRGLLHTNNGFGMDEAHQEI